MPTHCVLLLHKGRKDWKAASTPCAVLIRLSTYVRSLETASSSEQRPQLIDAVMCQHTEASTRRNKRYVAVRLTSDKLSLASSRFIHQIPEGYKTSILLMDSCLYCMYQIRWYQELQLEISVIFTSNSSHIPSREVAVFFPVHYTTDEERIWIVLRPGHKVWRAISQGHMGPGYSVVHRWEHGTPLEKLTVLVCQKLDEACSCSGVLLFQNIDHLKEAKVSAVNTFR